MTFDSSSAETSEQERRHVRHKIRSTEELAKLSEQAHAQGRSVVLCHGVFDLLHLGHVRHIEAARREGDVLIVTVTADRFVNKGPGRPVFTDNLRAEMLAALEYVDWVGVNHEPHAATLLSMLKPDVYVKGGDYKNSQDDVTGNINLEAQTQHAHGGRIVFTEEITYSSSALINRHLDVYSPGLQRFLDELRSRDFLPQVLRRLEQLSTMKVLVVGDAIIDEYQYVEPMGKSAKETMIATRYTGKEVFAGGVFATANHLAGFVGQVDVLTCLGDHDSYEELIRSRLKPGIGLKTVHKSNAPTTRKCRFIDGYSLRKLFEVCHLDDYPLAGSAETEFIGMFDAICSQYDMVLVNDFGHGLLTRNAIEVISSKARFLAVNAQSNSANFGYNLITKYPKVDFVCIDAMEARLAVRDKHAPLDVVVGELMPRLVTCNRLAVTQGKNGCLVYSKEAGLEEVPVLTDSIVDTMGAGDAFFAVTAPLVAVGAPMTEVGFMGNAAGALKVGILGHRASVEKAPLVKFVTTLLK